MGAFKLLMENFLERFCANDPVLACLPENYRIYGGFLRMAAEIVLTKGREPTDDEVEEYLRNGGDIDVKVYDDNFDHESALAKFEEKTLVVSCYGPRNETTKDLDCLLVWRDYIRYEINLRVDIYTRDYAPNQMNYAVWAGLFVHKDAVEAIFHKHLMPLFDPDESNLKLLGRMSRLWSLGYRPADEEKFAVWLTEVVQHVRENPGNHLVCDADLSVFQKEVVMRDMVFADVFNEKNEILREFSIK